MQSVHYEIFGSGDPTFLLVHNAGGDHHFFDPQITLLQTLGTVIAVDLPGHGKSTPYEGPCTISQYAHILNKICAPYDNIVGIGLNYGSNILIEMGQLSQLIMIDPPILLDTQTKTFIQNHIVELLKEDPKNYAKTVVDSSFIQVDQHIKSKALKSFSVPSSKVRAEVYEDLLKWDLTSSNKIKRISIPSLCIFTDSSLCSISKLQECNPQIQTSKVCKSLYWATIEVPDQINAMITRYVSTV